MKPRQGESQRARWNKVTDSGGKNGKYSNVPELTQCYPATKPQTAVALAQ